jgi:hypothetical protein
MIHEHERRSVEIAQTEDDHLMLNNREWAILIWLGIFLAWALSRKDVRSSFSDLLRTSSNPKILVPLGGMSGYVALEVWLGHKASLWRSELAKDTIVWFIVSASALFFKYEQASTQPHFFRRRVAAAFGITAFLEFFTNLFVLNLIAELFLLPFLALLAMLSVVADKDERSRSVKKLVDGLLALIGLALLAFASRQMYANWAHIDKHAALLQLVLPIWLTIGLLPFIYLVSLYANYESAFLHINFATDDQKARRHAKLALVTKLHFRSRDSHDFAGPWYQRIASAPNFGAARRVVAEFQKSRRAVERAAIEEQKRLRRYAGSDETDAEGRRLDRREFKETIKALRWLATCEEGWYYNKDHEGPRYRADLLEALGNDFFSGYGLPSDPGITMKVSKNGHAWYAWRRTVTGWCFAIGAASPPPDQWEYDGPEPPRGFPGRDRRWGERAFSNEVNANWLEPEADAFGPNR